MFPSRVVSRVDQASETRRIATKVKEIIESSYTTDISLDEISAQVGVSKFAVSRAFGKCFRATPIRYLWDYRVSMAASKLTTEPNKLIMDVAAECGFNSVQHFSRLFRANMGMTASDFINATRSEQAFKAEHVTQGEQCESSHVSV